MEQQIQSGQAKSDADEAEKARLVKLLKQAGIEPDIG
jgi:hypothetical protein